MKSDKIYQELLKHRKEVGELLGVALLDVISRIVTHDNSKFSDKEWPFFVEYTPRLKKTTYGSPKYKENLKKMAPAIKHHYANNRHHPEYFKEGVGGMNLVDLIEMLCDWIAATKRHEDGNIEKSLKINQKRFGYSDELNAVLRNTVEYLMNGGGR